MQTNDDLRDEDGTRPSSRRYEPDAHGQAALLLIESILHVLVEAKALSPEQAIDAVRTASEVKVDVAAETGESSERMKASLALLSDIARSLEIDSRFGRATPQT